MGATPLSQLEKSTTIPDGSLHLIEMGDGSGTKAVTQETLVKETGNALKIGNLAELQTENKENLVTAINEAARSGGGGASVDILDSKEEIEANTEPEKVAGALAVKEMFGALNDKLQGFEPVVDPETGQITGYKTTAGGADTVFPFSKSCKPIGTFTANTSQQTFSVTSICPDYRVLTAKNFMIAVENITIYTNSGGGTGGNGQVSGSAVPSISYNANSGVLTLSATSITKYGNSPTSNMLYTTVGISGNIYRV